MKLHFKTNIEFRVQFKEYVMVTVLLCKYNTVTVRAQFILKRNRNVIDALGLILSDYLSHCRGKPVCMDEVDKLTDRRHLPATEVNTLDNTTKNF